MSERYNRQTQVQEIGLEGQHRIDNSCVFIVGCGGLGCQVGAQLAGAGVGSIAIIDPDKIELSNLHRQILFRETDLGESKAIVMAQALRDINSDINVVAHHSLLTSSTITTTLVDADIVIDATDNFAASFLLSNYCRKNNIPLVAASVNRTFGWVGIFCHSQGVSIPGIESVFTTLAASVNTCDTVGVTGPSVGIIASIQAQEVLKVILADNSQLAGKLLYFDLWKYQQHTIDFSQATTTTTLISFLGAEQITDSDNVIDVRHSHESAQAPLKFKQLSLIPVDTIETHYDQFHIDQHIVCACVSGQRALIAASKFQKFGFSNISVLLP